jgi:hypothetical protein
MLDKFIGKIFKKKTKSEIPSVPVEANPGVLVIGTDIPEQPQQVISPISETPIVISPRPMNEILMLNTELPLKRAEGHYYTKYIEKVNSLVPVSQISPFSQIRYSLIGKR